MVSLRKISVPGVAGASLLLVGILSNLGCESRSTQAAGGRRDGMAVPVVVATVSQKDVPVNIDVIGNVEAYSTISVKAQIGGELTKVSFHEGDFVKKNDLLFTIDPRPYEAALSQAQANLSRDKAAVGQAEANLARDMFSQKYTQVQSGRYQKLLEAGVVSKEQADQMRSAADSMDQTILADKASIDSAKAQIGASQAAIETAKVQMSYTAIRSPIDGRTGNLSVKQGNIVTANSMELVTIAEVQPIYVTFSVPEAQLGEVKKFMAQGNLAVNATAQDDNTQRETGVLTFVDNSVDSTTGTIKLKGTFQNEDRKLWPGEFLRVTLRLTTHPHAVVVPNQAVQTGQDGQFVYVVKDGQTKDAKTVEMRPVVTGSRVDQELVIESGLTPGETIVIEGQLRLAPGSAVQVRDGRELPGGGRKRPPGKAS
jgi:multidrug efflux system membrane fusion protein